MKHRSAMEKPTDDSTVTEMHSGARIITAMREYGTYVIEDRAVPDFRDGMKPSQRRLLYAMKTLGITPTGNTTKSARITGHTGGVFHPHGTASLYGALVELTHSRYPMVQGHGNFGSAVTPPAADRYTECRFHKLANEHFACLDVADMVQNYSATDDEPLIINTRLPVLMMNGASGIAVGMSTNIPAHNLSELVGALIYVAKTKAKATVEGMLAYLSGPDGALGGILTSPKSDVGDLYRNGCGRLEYTCEYRFEKDGNMTNIVVFGFPDAFSISGFVTKMEAMAEARIIKYVESDFELPPGKKSDNEKRVIVRVGVDNKTAMEKVVKALSCAESYQFNVTIREADGTRLRANMPMLSYMKLWLRWRKSEEKKMLELEKARLNESLRKEELRLLGIVNIDTVLAAVKQSRVDPAEYLSKHLKISLADAQFIGAIPVFQLKRANGDDQRNKIKNLKAEIVRVDGDLAQLTKVVIRHLKKLEPYFDARRTRVGARGPLLSKFETTGDPITMLASRDGKLFTNVTEKGSTTADVLSATSFSGAVIFDESGLTQVISTTECDGKAGPAYKNIVGIAPHETTNLIVIGKNGFAIKMPGAAEHKQSEFQSIKGTTLVAGFGLNPDSQLLVWGKKYGEFACVRGDKIKEVRKNTGGVKIVGFKPVRALVVHNGQYLYTDEGTRVQPAKAGDIVDKIKLFVINDRNIVIYKTGRRKFMDRAATIKEISRDSAQVRFVYPASLPKTGPITESPDTAETAPTSKKVKKAEKPTKSVRTGKVVSKMAKKKAK